MELIAIGTMELSLSIPAAAITVCDMMGREMITVYGVDHSPWVQAVLMALHRRGLTYRLISSPLSPGDYLKHGMVMPRCRWPDGTVTTDSFAIMGALDQRYPSPEANVELHHDDQTALEELFVTYALARTGWGKTLAFLRGWMEMPSGAGAGLASVGRAAMFIYFFALILGGRHQARRVGFDPDGFEKCRFHLAKWNQRLKDQPFLAGRRPGHLDVALLGHIQCMLTGLTDETIPLVKAQPNLRDWIARLRGELSGYDSDFTVRLTQSEKSPRRASMLDQLFFALSLTMATICFPLTGLFLFDALRRREKNPARSGARLPKSQQTDTRNV